LVASRGPSPVRGFIAAIECSLHMSRLPTRRQLPALNCY
jgi:hypothetical protein